MAAAGAAALVVSGSAAAGAAAETRTRLGAGLLFALLCMGVGAHLEANLRGVAAPPGWAPALGAGFALMLWATSVDDRPRQRSFGSLAATALLIALAALTDHGRRGFVPLPWTLLAPAAGMALAAASAASMALAAQARRRLLPATGLLATAVGGVGLALHWGAPSHALPGLTLLQRIALPPPLLAPLALALLGLWGVCLAGDRGPVAVVWLHCPGRLSHKQEFSRKRPTR